uniref:Uncharacterized protein n=1 Tax=Zea mays TaxID=4577 RepID=C0PCM2_MAIZE|nr:unknown [Zea mays]
MDDVYGRIEVFPQHFVPSKEAMETPDGLSTSKNSLDSPPSSCKRSWTPRRVKGAASILHLLSIPRIRWSTSNEDDDKVTHFHIAIVIFFGGWGEKVWQVLCLFTVVGAVAQISTNKKKFGSRLNYLEPK